MIVDTNDCLYLLFVLTDFILHHRRISAIAKPLCKWTPPRTGIFQVCISGNACENFEVLAGPLRFFLRHSYCPYSEESDSCILLTHFSRDVFLHSLLIVGGRIAYLLWGSVYAVKQVDTRSRVLVVFDQLKAKIWGRDVSQF